MTLRMNLVAILLTLGCVAGALENTRLMLEKKQQGQHRGYPVGKRILQEAYSKILQHYVPVLRAEEKTKVAKVQTQSNGLSLWKDNLEGRDHPRRRKRKMDRTMMALLLAYKMKFMALVPTLVGGLILLKATALLAGFFFALFAAVLGLKMH